ncbi:hypothetical protein [Mycolicibacterium komossense]|uniref:Uncharacterized protein n=1 Tax=Mycolicibacterium komossense TaxID=1779 RepID=A0ABT3CMR4_9MYCO|nr:hypothetical protein [Mycolicibacterium komossense]MCV7230707.1 hypothetical protein [Mycolicibacterium komossense]
MIRIEIEPDTAAGYVLRVRDGDNHNILLSSTSQSYANEQDAERLAKRLFASLEVWSQVVGVDPPFTEPEPVGLLVTYRNGQKTTGLVRGKQLVDDGVDLLCEIEADKRTGYVFRVVTRENDNVLLSSTSQSYLHPDLPIRLARRLFGLAPFGPGSNPEPVWLTVTYRNGTTRKERIR